MIAILLFFKHEAIDENTLTFTYTFFDRNSVQAVFGTVLPERACIQARYWIGRVTYGERGCSRGKAGIGGS